jgi:hypothetical protein
LSSIIFVHALFPTPSNALHKNQQANHNGVIAIDLLLKPQLLAPIPRIADIDRAHFYGFAVLRPLEQPGPIGKCWATLRYESDALDCFICP